MKNGIKKVFLFSLVSLLLFSSVFSSYVYAAKTDEDNYRPNADEELEEESDFEWDEGNQSDALFVWEANEWAQYQDRLKLKGYVPKQGHATLNSTVEGLRNDVRRVLNSENTDIAGIDFAKLKYTDLVLAMIQVLAEEDGIFTGDADSDGNFTNWVTSMGRLVRPDKKDYWNKDESIREVFYSFIRSVNAYEAQHKDQVSPLELTDGLWVCVEGVVMRDSVYGKGEGGYAFPMTRTKYSAASAISHYSAHQESIDTYYAQTDLGDYKPDDEFAKRVKAIYNVSEGYGTGAEADALAPNDKVQKVISWLYSHADGKGYSQANRLGPDSYDCSGLVYCALKNSGAVYNAPNITTSGFGDGVGPYKEISLSQIKAGDVLWHSGHVAFYIGPAEGGKIKTFEAMGTKWGTGEFTTRLSRFTKAYRWW